MALCVSSDAADPKISTMAGTNHSSKHAFLIFLFEIIIHLMYEVTIIVFFFILFRWFMLVRLLEYQHGILINTFTNAIL